MTAPAPRPVVYVVTTIGGRPTPPGRELVVECPLRDEAPFPFRVPGDPRPPWEADHDGE